MQIGTLRLLQLADSALPIGALAHSFGLETLVAEGILAPEHLETFLVNFLEETGRVEAIFCRVSSRLSAVPSAKVFETSWMRLNRRLSALKLSRESREASAVLGRRFLRLVAGLENHPRLHAAATMAGAETDIHHCTAFGLVAGVLQLGEDQTVLAFLQQTAMALISASQRVMPVGQGHATRLLWQLQPTILAVTAESVDLDPTAVASFNPLLEIGSMRHARLPVRLFIS